MSSPSTAPLALFGLLALSACSAKYDTDTGTVVGADGDDGGGSDGGSDGGGGDGDDSLPDLLQYVSDDTSNCEQFDGVDVAGASVYWWSEFRGNEEDGWVGEERWYIMANSTLEDTGFGDCVVTWNLTARASDSGACQSCDLGVVTQASVDTDATSCDPDLWSSDSEMSEHYGIFRGPGGEATWYWATSGNRMAEGFYADNGDMNFLIDEVCRWF